MLVKLCKALDCSLSYIIEGNDLQKYDDHAKDVSKLLDGCSPYMVKLVSCIIKTIKDADYMY